MGLVVRTLESFLRAGRRSSPCGLINATARQAFLPLRGIPVAVYLISSRSKQLSKAQFHVTVRTHINKSVVDFTVRRNVKFWCSEC